MPARRSPGIKGSWISNHEIDNLTEVDQILTQY